MAAQLGGDGTVPDFSIKISKTHGFDKRRQVVQSWRSNLPVASVNQGWMHRLAGPVVRGQHAFNGQPSAGIQCSLPAIRL
jgi:hypothetical protein